MSYFTCRNRGSQTNRKKEYNRTGNSDYKSAGSEIASPVRQNFNIPSRFSISSGSRSCRPGRVYGRGGFTGNSRGRYGRSGGRRKPGYKFDESMFIKKVEAIVQETEYTPSFKFDELDVSPILKRNIRSKNYDIPTRIQDQAIKHIINGSDLLGVADTGSGKTAAFLIPLIDKIIKNNRSKTLIITPTRELTDQINQELVSFTRGMQIYSVQCIGGNSINNQIYNLRRSYNFVVGTPGRLKDLLGRRVLNLSAFDTIVLDEVDRMLDIGFVNEIKYLISYLPQNRQSLCFSATVYRKVEEIVNSILKGDHIKVSVKTGETARNIEQDVVRVEKPEDKLPKLEELLKTDGYNKVLIFANTKWKVDRLDKYLYRKGYNVESIHGDIRQNKRKRSLDNFRAGRSNILIATDVAARGLDIDGITHVINYDIPMRYEDYIHRVGRTGRANNKGMALTFIEKNNFSYQN